MSQLSTHQFDRKAGTKRLNGPMVPAVMKSEDREPYRLLTGSMVILDLPPIDPAEDSLSRRQGSQMGDDEWPCPGRDIRNAVAGMALGATGTNRSLIVIEIVLNQVQESPLLDAGAIGQGVQRTPRLIATLDNADDILQLVEYGSWGISLRSLDLTRRIGVEDLKVLQIPDEATDRRQVLELRGARRLASRSIRLPVTRQEA